MKLEISLISFYFLILSRALSPSRRLEIKCSHIWLRVLSTRYIANNRSGSEIMIRNHENNNNTTITLRMYKKVNKITPPPKYNIIRFTFIHRKMDQVMQQVVKVSNDTKILLCRR